MEGDPEPQRRRRPAPAPAPEIPAPKTVARSRPRLPRPAPDVSPPETAPAAALPERPTADGELPEVFRERIRALGKRKRSKPLRQLILDICAVCAWTTVGEFAEWLGMDGSNLQKRHLRPRLKSGQLRLRYPENRSHPEQAYGAGAP